jgi:hypothetical protein
MDKGFEISYIKLQKKKKARNIIYVLVDFTSPGKRKKSWVKSLLGRSSTGNQLNQVSRTQTENRLWYVNFKSN